MASILELIREKADSGSLPFEQKHLYWIGILAVFGFAFWVRALPADTMRYLQALDPYMIARMSAGIVQHGHLPAIDVLRFFPYATPTYLLNLGNIYIPAYLFYVARLFGLNFLTWAKIYPALMGALAVFPVYWLGTELFDRRTGLLSAFFLSSSVAIMHRSSAGWFEKEPIANLFMVSSLYLFVRAWNRKDWRSGIGAGICLGLSATAWGGSKFLFLLYPITVFALILGLPLVMAVPSLMFGRDLKVLDVHEGLVAAFTPTALLGTILPFMLNGSTSTWTIPNNIFFILNMLVLAFLWIRYGVEKYGLVEGRTLAYFSVGLFVAGLIALGLSPLYSQTLASSMSGIINAASQSGGSVIGGTVAENAPSSVNQVVSRMGASFSAAILPGAQLYSSFFSGWTFSLVGMAVLLMSLAFMVLKHYFDVARVKKNTVIGGASAALGLVVLWLFYAFPGSNVAGFLPAMAIVGIGSVLLFAVEYYGSEEYEQWVMVTEFLWVAVFGLSIFLQNLPAMAVLVLVQGIFVWMAGDMEFREVKMSWPYLIVLAWIVSTVYGATQRSRLLFLAATPVSFVAGVAVSKGLQMLSESGIWDWIQEAYEEVDASVIVKTVSAVIVLAVVAVNASAVYVMGEGVEVNGRHVGGIGGSPNGLWMENLEYMRDNTPPGSVVLSWWDYGYWFQTIGARPAVADGGNMGYYTGEGIPKINRPLAQFLTSHNASEWRGWLDELSVDYVVLDNTMIGKYSAVSQIANWDNAKFNSMRTLNCVNRDGQCAAMNYQNQTVIPYSLSGNADILVPIRRVNGGVVVSGTPVMRLGQVRVQVANICSSGGIQRMTEDAGTQGGFGETLTQQALTSGRPFGGCVAIDPYAGLSRIILVPPAIMDSTLVRLYLMDGAGIDFVEEEFDNGFVKMWKVN